MGQRTTTYCQAPGCDEPTKEGRRFCPRDTKRHQRQMAGRSAPPLGSPPAERLPPMERAIEAFGLLAETPAEDDALYEKRRRDLELVLQELGRRARPEAIRRGMERARAQGKHIGRPRKLTDDQRIHQVAARIGKTAAAEFLGVDLKTLSAALARREKGSLSPVAHKREHPEKGSLSPARSS